MKKTLPFIIILLTFQLFSQDYTWKTLATGAGGWMTGLDIHPSGNPVFTKSDVGSAYRYDPVSMEWVNIVTAEHLPESDVYWNRFGGVLSIVSAPSNNNRAYLAYFDGIYKSDNQGDDWSRTNFPVMDLAANDDESKFSGERLSVDPSNADIVYFGSTNDGLWRSMDAGDTWQQVSAIPSGIAERGVRQILFNPSSNTTNGMTQQIYVTIDGVDVFQSNDAGQTWSSTGLSATFTEPIFLDTEIDAQGNLYCVGRDIFTQSIGIQKYDGASWNSLQNNGTVYFNVAIDPFNPNRVIALSEGFTETALTQNANTNNPTWVYPTHELTANNIPWLAWAEGDWFSIGEMVFDPVVENKLWISDGVGVWNINDINNNNLVWVENARNQEHLVSNDLVVNADGKVITAHWDRPIFLHDDNDQYPNIHQPSSRFNSSWDMDVCPNDPNFVVAITEDHRYCCYDVEHRNSGYSTDGGVTWTTFPTMPDPSNTQGIYGNIAVSATDIDNIVWLPTGNDAPYYTTDRGTTWNPVSLPNDQGECCLNFNFVYKKALAADKVLDHTFYLYNWENGSIYISEDAGATWQERTALQDFYGWNAKLSSTPEQANHLWFSHGAEQAINFMQPLKRSTDGGLTWSTLNNTSEVLNHAIGKALPGANYPTLFIQGRVNGEFGYWMSSDEGNSWEKIGIYPNGIYDVAKVLEADVNIPSRLYIGFAGNGFVYGQNDDLVLSNSPTWVPTHSFTIYPNPTSDIIGIKGDDTATKVSIYTSNGQLLRTWNNQLGIREINIGDFPSGLYFLSINSGDILNIVKE